MMYRNFGGSIIFWGAEKFKSRESVSVKKKSIFLYLILIPLHIYAFAYACMEDLTKLSFFVIELLIVGN